MTDVERQRAIERTGELQKMKAFRPLTKIEREEFAGLLEKLHEDAAARLHNPPPLDLTACYRGTEVN
jgi:hypothetical protein